MRLHNKYSKEDLLRRLEVEDFRRVTLSFYRYVRISNLDVFRNHLYSALDSIGVLGRIYLAHEGINAQVNVPEQQLDALRRMLDDNGKLKGIRLNFAVEEGKSFLKLIVRIRKKIVADGLDDNAFDVTNVGRHLDAEAFNRALEDPDTMVIDMRNHYESEVGRFDGALCPGADTFRELLPKAVGMARGAEDKKVLLYCTGGIRCEKASAYFRHNGFRDVSQLYGGIITYARAIRKHDLPSKFIGKNFVFDERLGERITDDVISTCHQCGRKADTHVNCANEACHLLFIQCAECAGEMEGCCSHACREALLLPAAERRATARNNHHQRVRPVLKPPPVRD